MLFAWEQFCAFIFAKSSLEFFRIHMHKCSEVDIEKMLEFIIDNMLILLYKWWKICCLRYSSLATDYWNSMGTNFAPLFADLFLYSFYTLKGA
jgi:hypothetical protein